MTSAFFVLSLGVDDQEDDMSDTYSYAAMIEFLDYASDHGLMKAPTARSYRVAAGKVQDELTEQEANDVRQIDLDLVFQRFVNRNKVGVAPKTLRVYKRRIATVVEEFVAWRENPTGYRPQIGSRRSRGDEAPKGKAQPLRIPTESKSRDPEPSAPQGAAMLTIPFPLRADFVVSVQVPRDLKAREAERLAAFIKTLAADFVED